MRSYLNGVWTDAFMRLYVGRVNEPNPVAVGVCFLWLVLRDQIGRV